MCLYFWFSFTSPFPSLPCPLLLNYYFLIFCFGCLIRNVGLVQQTNHHAYRVHPPARASQRVLDCPWCSQQKFIRPSKGSNTSSATISPIAARRSHCEQLVAPIALGPTKASSKKTLQERMLQEKSVINIENGFRGEGGTNFAGSSWSRLVLSLLCAGSPRMAL